MARPEEDAPAGRDLQTVSGEPAHRPPARYTQTTCSRAWIEPEDSSLEDAPEASRWFGRPRRTRGDDCELSATQQSAIEQVGGEGQGEEVESQSVEETKY